MRLFCVRRTKNQSGQVSILVGLMMTTFMFFFAFVLNTGMLVNAKINLQNAADLAAYAGAAVQARQLNSISYLNYEMRRQYKKFLFRYYVLGTMAQKSTPTDVTDFRNPRNWSPDGTTPHNVPGVCVMFKANDNYCQNTSQEAIDIPPNATAALDAIQSTLIQQLRELENIRSRGCERMGTTNSVLMALWLFNMDPTLNNVANSSSDVRDSMNVLRALAQGLGLVPKELILKKRIQTLQSYVNALPRRDVTFDAANAMKSTGDVNANERTIQAFMSAYSTLGPHTFSDTESILMDEILPTNGDKANLLDLNPLNIKFETYAYSYEQRGSGACHAILNPIAIMGELPVGFEKKKDSLTYYAIRLRAKAKLLFTPAPWGDLTLTAYSAAQPFGSRIGPQFESQTKIEEEFTAPDRGMPPDMKGLAQDFPLPDRLPNIAIFEGDSATAGGYLLNGVQASYLNTMKASARLNSANNQGTHLQSNTVTMDSMNYAIHAAMAPTPSEKGKYNIPESLPGERFHDLFDEDTAKGQIWAPLTPKDKTPDEVRQEITDLITSFTTPTGAVTSGRGNVISNPLFKEKLIADMNVYLGKLSRGV